MWLALVVLALVAARLAAAIPVPAVDVTAKALSKRGIAYTSGAVTGLFPSPAVSWTYNWASKASSVSQPGHEFVPMLYNGIDANWDANVASALRSGSKHLLAMNEPDQPTNVGGTALSPQQAAQMYKAQMNPYKGKARLGAPAVSAGGIAWLQQFADACNGGCHIDFVPLHFYDYSHPDAGIQATSLHGWLAGTIPQVRAMFNNPDLLFWLTEFAAVPVAPLADATSVAYMNQVLPDLAANPAIARYAYFYGDAMASGENLNAAGTRYMQRHS